MLMIVTKLELSVNPAVATMMLPYVWSTYIVEHLCYTIQIIGNTLNGVCNKNVSTLSFK